MLGWDVVHVKDNEIPYILRLLKATSSLDAACIVKGPPCRRRNFAHLSNRNMLLKCTPVFATMEIVSLLYYFQIMKLFSLKPKYNY